VIYFGRPVKITSICPSLILTSYDLSNVHIKLWRKSPFVGICCVAYRWSVTVDKRNFRRCVYLLHDAREGKFLSRTSKLVIGPFQAFTVHFNFTFSGRFILSIISRSESWMTLRMRSEAFACDSPSSNIGSTRWHLKRHATTATNSTCENFLPGQMRGP
jgi:hypothetical protein